MSAGDFTENLQVSEKRPQSRFLVSKLGRFAQADTLIPDYKLPQYLNKYSYVQNRPMVFVDPSGHSFCEYDRVCDSSGGGGGYDSGVSNAELAKLGSLMTIAQQTRNQTDFQVAVDYAVSISTVDFSNVVGEIKFDPALADEAQASVNATVKVGPGAFISQKGYIHSPGYLLLVLVHEIEGHINRQLYEGRWYLDSVYGSEFLNEMEATDLQLDLALQYRLESWEIRILQGYRDIMFDWFLEPEEQEKIEESGDYSLPTDASGNPYDPTKNNAPVKVATPPQKTYSPPL